jgi:hypothetical protein
MFASYFILITACRNGRNNRTMMPGSQKEQRKGWNTRRIPRTPESIEGFIADQAFSQSYDLAPPTPSLVRNLDRRQTGRLGKRKLADRRGGAKSYDSEKAWSSINY